MHPTARAAPSSNKVGSVHNIPMPTPAPVSKPSENLKDIDFVKIKSVCESDKDFESINKDPQFYKDHRQKHWPDPNVNGLGIHLSHIYKSVKDSGLPNAIGQKLLLPSQLNVSKWEELLSQSDDDQELLSFIKYGFPLGYLGPVSDSKGTDNHTSAVNYPTHVSDFIRKEIHLGGVIGPMDSPPFQQWAHVSPLMSRPKKGSEDRRIIIDMTFPGERSINAYLCKNSSLGIQRDHTLPSVDDVVKILGEMGPGAYMCTMDVSRAYKNFSSCPLDWPLLAFRWDEKYYCDVTMPFGARSSSCHMQRIANAISEMLSRKGITSRVYLDDIIIVSPDQESARQHFQVAQTLLHDLGLPESVDKRQPPSTVVTWLGVQINSEHMSLAIPHEKISDAQESVSKAIRCRTISKKHLQSILGKLLHIAKCIRPARLFVSRLLEALRGMTRNFIRVTPEMRLDLQWFRELAQEWNGIAMIPSDVPDRVIVVDASGSGIGGYDDTRAYGGAITPVNDPVANISELEAANVVIAVHTFLSKQDRGSHILVKCDNLGSVQVFQTGKGRNRVLLECARYLWMAQAMLDLRISYAHIAGECNTIADSLSRLHISGVYRDCINHFMSENRMRFVTPELHLFKHLTPSLTSRRGVRVAPVKSR